MLLTLMKGKKMNKKILLTAIFLFIAGTAGAQVMRSYNPKGYTEVNFSNQSWWTNKTNDGKIVSETNDEFFSTVYDPATGAVAFYIRPTSTGVEFLDANKKVGIVVLNDSERVICYDEAFCKMVEKLGEDDDEDDDWF